MKKLFAAFLFSAVLLTPVSLYAAAGPLDIHEALILTLQNNSSLLSLRQELAKAEAFLAAHFDAIGERSSTDIVEKFL